MKRYYGIKIVHASGAVIRTRCMFISIDEAHDFGQLWFTDDFTVIDEFR